MTARIGVIEFPGTNCERESLEAIRRVGMEPISFRWNEDPKKLAAFDGYLIAGGFSYEDRSRSGIIAALDPIISYVRKENEKGKPILGICNGAQILVETGLVPGLPDYRLGAALADNRRIKDGKIAGTGFYNAWVHIKAGNIPDNFAFARKEDEGSVMRIPAAHAEGRFIIPPELLTKMHDNRMTLFRYSDGEGNLNPDFPVNPNGSVDNIAGISNAAGTALALMPHPERTEAGDPIFSALKEYIEKNSSAGSEVHNPLLTDDDIPAIGNEGKPFRKGVGSKELIVELIISDNEAVSVENALRRRGIGASVQRRSHWEITLEPGLSPQEMEQVMREAATSGELYNPNKEYETQAPMPAAGRNILVRDLPGEDTMGAHKLHALTDWFSIEKIEEVRSGTLWTIIPDTEVPNEAAAVCDAAENTHIFTNPYAKERYLYEA